MNIKLMHKNLLISIVTICYNDRDGLDRTIDSVNIQDYDNIEHIIIDGKSSDGTTELLHQKTIRGRWISETDDGIYHAMNKGMRMCSGDFVLMLNAGDTLISNSIISAIVDGINDQGEMNAVYFGRANIFSENNNTYYPPYKINKDNIKSWLKVNVPNHQATLYPVNWYKSNNYDTNYKILGDSEYKYKSKKHINYIFIDKVIVEFSYGGISSAYSNIFILKTMIVESWKLHTNINGYIFALKRIISHILKYALIKLKIKKI